MEEGDGVIPTGVEWAIAGMAPITVMGCHMDITPAMGECLTTRGCMPIGPLASAEAGALVEVVAEDGDNKN